MLVYKVQGTSYGGGACVEGRLSVVFGLTDLTKDCFAIPLLEGYVISWLHSLFSI